jgi:hypothetical protein
MNQTTLTVQYCDAVTSFIPKECKFAVLPPITIIINLSFAFS